MSALSLLGRPSPLPSLPSGLHQHLHYYHHGSRLLLSVQKERNAHSIGREAWRYETIMDMEVCRGSPPELDCRIRVVRSAISAPYLGGSTKGNSVNISGSQSK